MNFVFFFNNILLGIGLAADAFSVSLANGLHEPCMRKSKLFSIAGVFAFFQGLMPLLGWLCVHTVLEYFTGFQPLIPWIALALLSIIGGKMIYDSRKQEGDTCSATPVNIGGLIIQGIATSIDALSAGFTIAEYSVEKAVLSALIISAITFSLCLLGLIIGKKAGTHMAEKAGIWGGLILIFIGLEIFITGVFNI